MQFHIPQFIEIEDKIFGPLTFKQFIFVIGGVGWAFLAWTFLPKLIALVVIVPVSGLAFLLAFKPIHGRPFAIVFEAGFKYLFGNKLYLWKQGEAKEEELTIIGLQEERSTLDNLVIPRVSEGKLSDLSWSLDIKTKKQEDDVPIGKKNV